MTKTKRAIFSLLLSLIVLISALVFPASITHVSAEENVVSAFEERNVLDDLNGAVIGGEEFDLKDYPYNPFGRPQLIYFAEFGYSVKEDKQSDYGLYVYVYNPQEIALDVDTARNKIQFTYGDKESYLKYSLDFLNYSDEPGYEGRFYKFKVRLYDSERQDILNAVDYNGRVYKISGIELSYKGEVTEYSVAQTYTYTGFAKGYGSELATGDTVSAQVDGFEDIDRRADAHQVARLVFREDAVDDLNHLVHLLGRFAHRQSADGVAVRFLGSHILCRADAEVGIDAALHDGEEALPVAIRRLRLVETLEAAVQPALGQPQ